MEAAELQKSVLLEVSSFYFSILNIICKIKVQMNWTKEMCFQNKIFCRSIQSDYFQLFNETF